MLSEQIRFPISQDAPCGADVRYDEDFESLKAEIGKHSAVGARTDFDRLVERGSALVGRAASADVGATLVEVSGGIDYSRVVDLATGILTSKSKDLQVAGYLCLGSLRTAGYEGLAAALETYQSLVETWWDTFFPELRRLEARRLAVSWLAQRGSEAVAQQAAEPGDGPAIERAIAACRAVDAFLKEKIADNAPTLSALARALAEHKSAVPTPVAPRASVADGLPSAPEATPTIPAPAPSMTPESPEDALIAVARASDLLRAASPESPLGYRLLRCARWDTIETNPPDQGGRTLIPPPEDHARTRLAAITSMPAGADALAGCEELFYDWPHPYRLEIQRIVDQSMAALGSSYAAARRALRHDLALLLKRLPGLEKLSFADGTPFTDAATLDWIEREIRPLADHGASPVRTSIPAGGATDEALVAELAEADTLAGEGNLAGGLEKLEAGQESDGRARTRFLRQFHMARLCLSGNQAAIARPFLEDLDRQIERFGLGRWEPELCGQVWTLLQRCYQHLLQDEAQDATEIRKRLDRVFHKLCRLDVRAALSEGGRR